VRQRSEFTLRLAAPAIAALAALTAALAGCERPDPPLTDRSAILAARSVLVITPADAPGPKHSGSGRSLRGVVQLKLLQMEKLSVKDVLDEALLAEFDKAGYSFEDRYDPAVAAAVGRQLGVDVVATGELLHLDRQQEMTTTTVVILSGGGTETTHWVAMNLRLVNCADGRIIYAGSGQAHSPDSYNAAADQAADQAFAHLRYVLKAK